VHKGTKMMKYRLHTSFALVAVVVLAAHSVAPAQEAESGAGRPATLDQAVSRALAYFDEAQANDGSFSAGSGPGITAIVASAMLRNGRTVNDPVVARALKYLEAHVRDDGGIYQEGSRYKNYETSLAMVSFNLANQDGRYKDLLAKAEKFVKGEQWDEGEGHEISSMSYGGAGYGSHSRPDLSNTTFLVDALHAVGRGEDDPALQKALVFISRCQNLESEHNTTEFAAKVNDGGFYYTIAAGGQSQAGPTPEGGLRSYGSMTYAGLKSMIHAGVSREDPRVKAAHEWIRRHYTLDENPGMGPQGLYYYYHTFAKALDTIGDDRLVDANSNSHDWRAELVQKLISTQKEDGSWINDNPRWLEGDPNLVTAYSLLALSYCRP
jgi:squalene-hopene/tetraprenyl-beta-curcumene cyclase